MYFLLRLRLKEVGLALFEISFGLGKAAHSDWLWDAHPWRNSPETKKRSSKSNAANVNGITMEIEIQDAKPLL